MFLFLQTRAWHPAKLLPLLAWYAAGSVCDRPSACLVSLSHVWVVVAARRCGGFAAVGPAGRKYRSIAARRRSAANAGGVTLSAGVGS